MELRDREVVATFFADAPLDAPAELRLDEDAANHARVRRISIGDRIKVTNGAGRLGIGAVLAVDRKSMGVAVDDVWAVDAPPEIYLFVPVADRDRMLMLAEKAVELGVTSWRPVLFQRSRSVVPRGEGDAFDRKLRARMVAALEQCAGAWLPTVHAPTTLDTVTSFSAATKLVMDAGGAPILGARVIAPIAAMIGPEGGITPEELTALEGSGWQRARLEGNTLRFESAGIAAAAVLRAMLGPK